MAQAAAGPDSSESFKTLKLLLETASLKSIESFARLLIEQIDRCKDDR